MKKHQSAARAVDDSKEDSDSNSDESKAQCSYTKTLVKQNQPAKNLLKKTDKQVIEKNKNLPFTAVKKNQHGMKRKLETSNANRGKKIPTPAAKCFGGTDQGGAKILVDSIEDVINQSMKEIIPINKKDHKPEINKTLCETIVSDQGEDNLNNDATNDFTNGNFVVRKSDMIDKNIPPIWKITNIGFLLKYIPLIYKKKMCYKNTSTFTGWIPRVMHHFYSAPTTLIKEKGNEHIVEFHKDKVVIDSDFVIPTTEELLGVIDEAMILAAEKKNLLKIQRETEMLSVNNENNTKEESHSDNAEDSSITAGPSDSCSQPETADNCSQPETADSCSQPETADKCSQPETADSCSQPETADSCSQPETADKCSQPETADSCSQPETADNCSQPETDNAIVKTIVISKRKSTRTPIKKINNCCSQAHHNQRTKKSKQLAHAPHGKEVDQRPDVIDQSDKFAIGSFIVLKTDVVGNNYPSMWKITNFKLLQRYCPYEKDGQMLYRNSLTYCSWISEQKNQYYPADVSLIRTTKKYHIIKLNKIIKDLEVTGRTQDV